MPGITGYRAGVERAGQPGVAATLWPGSAGRIRIESPGEIAALIPKRGRQIAGRRRGRYVFERRHAKSAFILCGRIANNNQGNTCVVPVCARSWDYGITVGPSARSGVITRDAGDD